MPAPSSTRAPAARVAGTTLEYALIPEVKAVPLPDTASFDLGANLGIPFLTAHRCLTVTTSPLHEAAKAHAAVQNSAIGKVLIDITD